MEESFLDMAYNDLGVTVTILITVLVLWSIVWKGLALWHSARLNHKGWFVALLIVNTAGILEIIYLFFVAKVHKKELPAESTKK